MKNKTNIKIILVFLVVFILGGITGAAIMPVIFSKVEGNPYSMDVLADRVYNTHFLKNAGLTPDQVEAVNMLSAKYVLKYTAERDMFMAKRRTLYSEYKYNLENILTKEQFENYSMKSDALMQERELYSKNMEQAWKEEYSKHTQARLKKEGFEKKLKAITITLPTNDIMPQNLDLANSQNKAMFDFLNRYMIDRVKYNWDTYKIYHEMNDNIIKEDDIEP